MPCRPIRVPRLAPLLSLFVQVLLAAAPALAAAPLEDWLERLDALRPRTAAALADLDLKPIAAAAGSVEQFAAELVASQEPRVEFVLNRTERILAVKARLDRGLDELLALRTGLAEFEPADKQRDAVRAWLRVVARWVDLAGRLRYMQFDVSNTAAGQLAAQPAPREKLVDLFIKYRSSVGAIVMSDALFDPPPDSPIYGRPVSPVLRSKLIELAAVTGETETLPKLATFVALPNISPALAIQAGEAIRRIGLPQDPRPGQDPTLPAPAITARTLRDRLARLNVQAPAELRTRRDALLAWLAERVKNGVDPAGYRWGLEDIKPGDWLLMRNPSPYNLFTDLSPGLFTHVGIVVFEKGVDGIGRMVLVDLPERGVRLPATNIDAFVQRSRHYLFLRHSDADVARQMGQAGASLVGNESRFDLNFRTDRVLELKGKPLAGQTITTYCTGLLLLCALQTDRPREEFFPITEFAAGGQSAANLAQLGMTFGKDFVTPSGGLFSTQLKIVNRREPTYDPRREVEEMIYDHFAQQLVVRKLQIAPDLYQSLRLKVAAASKSNPLLAQAITKAAGVNAETDLVSAAKAAAVVETLDEIAYGSSGEFLKALEAIRSAPADRREERMLPPAQRAALETYRARHRRLFDLWQQGQLPRRQLRIELVQYYVAQGKQQLDRRFFGGK
jgi:hypothetical protein